MTTMRLLVRAHRLTDIPDIDHRVDEYGLPNQPKYNHLSMLHSYLNRFGSTIVASDPVYVSYCTL